MDEEHKMLILKAFKKEMNAVHPDDVEKARNLSGVIYNNSQQFMALVEAVEQFDFQNGTQLNKIVPPLIVATLAMEITDSIDEAIILLKEWSVTGVNIIADCDKAINMG